MHAFLLLAWLSIGDLSAAERELRTYDLRFLTADVPQFPARPDDLSVIRSLALENVDRNLEYYGGVAGPLKVGEAAPAGVQPTAESIVKLIQKNIAEDSWANERNSMTVRREELVVVQTPAIHAEISRLLARLRGTRARMFQIEVAVLPVEALGDKVLDPSRPLVPDAFDAALKRAGAQGRRISLAAYNEQTVSGFSGQRRATVADTEINQTGVIPVANVIVETLPIGISLEAQPLMITGTNWIRLILNVVRLEVAGEIQKRETLFADLESVPLAEESLRTVLLLESGRAGLAGCFRESTPDGESREFALLARVLPKDIATEPPAPADSASVFQLRVYDVAFLLENSTARPLPGELFLALLKRNVEPESWKDQRTKATLQSHRLFVTARQGTHAKIALWIKRLVRRHARLAVVRLEIFEAPLEALLRLRDSAREGWLLEKDWRASESGQQAKLTLEASAVGLIGKPIALGGLERRTFVADVEPVSGGTGHSILETPDPVVTSTGSGFTLKTTVHELRDKTRVRLNLELERCHTRFVHRATYLAGASVTDPDNKSHEVDARRPYVIELPDQDGMFCRASTAIPLGQPAILKLEGTGKEDGRMVVATVNIRAVLDSLRVPKEGGR